MRLTKSKVFGFVMLLLSISLILLITAKCPNVKKENLYKNDKLEVPHGANNLFNITLQPSGKKDYHVEVTISLVSGPICVDLWVFNSTWIGPFLDFMDWVFSEYGSEFRDAYPDEYPFDLASTFANAKEINITGPKRIELVRVDCDGVYCFVFVNFYDVKQYVSVSVEEQYLDPNIPYRSILEPSLVNFSITFLTAAVGVYSLAKDKRHTKRKRYGKRLITLFLK